MKGVPMVERSFSGSVCPAGHRKLEVKVLSAPCMKGRRNHEQFHAFF